MKKLLLYSTLVTLVLGLSLTSCKKNQDEELDIETESSADNYNVERNINDVFKQVDESANASNIGKTGPTVTVDSTSNPRVMTINYGAGTLCNDNKIRAGKIIVTWTGKYRAVGTVITITTDSFYQNGNKLEGTKTIENKGRSALGNLYYQVSVRNAKLTTVDGKTATWNADRTREWISGESTPAWNDDVYAITGSSSGVSRAGLSYTSTITQTLRVDFSCDYRLTAGEIEIKPTGKLTRTINYGNGGCDNSFTVKIGNRTFTVSK